MRWLASPDIPFAKDDANRFLPWIIAFMVCLTGLTLAAVLTVQSALFRWSGEYFNSFTVQVPSGVVAEHNLDPQRLVGMLADNDWAESAREIPRAEMQSLIEPWLGSAATVEGLPLPLLVEVKLKSDAKVDVPALQKRLQRIAPGAEIDDYQLWMARFHAFSRNMQWIASGFAALMVTTTLALVVLAAKTSLRLHEKTVDVLYTIGAEDGYIARQFQRNASDLAFRGALLGTAAAFVLFALAGQMTAALESMLLPPLDITFAHIALFVSLPLITVFAASRFTHRSVLAMLAERQ